MELKGGPQGISRNQEPIVDTSGARETVPQEWPALRADAPGRVRTIHGLSALPVMVLLWFAPKRMGPFVAAAGWHAAVWAGLIGIGVGFGLPACGIDTTVAETYTGPWYLVFRLSTPSSNFTLSEVPRAPLAALVALIHTGASNPGWSATSGYTLLLILAAIPASLLALAAALMPFAAAGERLTPLFGRCMRLVLWSMTVLIPIGLAVSFWPWVLDHFIVAAPSPLDRPREMDELINVGNGAALLALVAITALGLWWLAILWRSGLRYAGAADGPAWRPRTPRCQKCGYIIATLRLDARCPECNHPVADSVARLRRKTKPTRWRLFTASLRDAISFAQRG